MSGTEQAGIGQTLREARETQGMSVGAVAARLRLMQRQVESIEAGDFEGLGRPVFARGFVRNYAKLLGIDPDSLLDRMAGPKIEPVSVHRPAPPLPRAWLSSPWLIALSLAGLAVVAVPVGLYWWLNQGEEELLHKLPLTLQVEPVELSAPAPAVPVPDAASADTPAADPASPPSTVETAAPADQTAAAAPTPAEAAAPVASVDTTAGGVLQFDFAGDSWVEIRDASGRTLHRQLNPAGSSLEVRGRPPFRVLVGNAAQARMMYNGRPIDLKPFIDVSVARFTLEE